MNLNQVESQEMSDVLVTLQLCNYNNPATPSALKSCAMKIMPRVISVPVREFLQMIQISPQPLRSIILTLQRHRPNDLIEGTLKLNH